MCFYSISFIHLAMNQTKRDSCEFALKKWTRGKRKTHFLSAKARDSISQLASVSVALTRFWSSIEFTQMEGDLFNLFISFLVLTFIFQKKINSKSLKIIAFSHHEQCSHLACNWCTARRWSKHARNLSGNHSKSLSVICAKKTKIGLPSLNYFIIVFRYQQAALGFALTLISVIASLRFLSNKLLGFFRNRLIFILSLSFLSTPESQMCFKVSDRILWSSLKHFLFPPTISSLGN